MPRSKLEEKLDEALAMLYPHDNIVEDMPIKVRGKTLFVDRVVKGAKLAVEIDGRQHDEFVEHFHKSAEGFMSHKERDALKEAWLRSNGYSLVRLKHNDSVAPAALRARIIEALRVQS